MVFRSLPIHREDGFMRPALGCFAAVYTLLVLNCYASMEVGS